jgi:hypothetical protein
VVSIGIAQADPISTRIMNPGVPISIGVSKDFVTTILLPSVPTGTFGLGLVNTSKGAGGSIQIEHPDGSPVLVLHALSDTAATTMTVLMDNALYVFELRSATMSPDIAVTMVKGDLNSKPREVSAEQIKEARIKFDPELLIGFERRAHDAEVLRKVYPNLYDGYSERSVQYTSDSGSVKTSVAKMHRFSKEDAIVLEGTVQNETSRPITFDGRATTVQVANEVHPAKLCDCLKPIPAGETVPIVVVLQGDIDGARANLSIDNEFRIILPPINGESTIWNLKNGVAPGAKFKVNPPIDLAIPLSQTGKPLRE